MTFPEIAYMAWAKAMPKPRTPSTTSRPEIQCGPRLRGLVGTGEYRLGAGGLTAGRSGTRRGWVITASSRNTS